MRLSSYNLLWALEGTTKTAERTQPSPHLGLPVAMLLPCTFDIILTDIANVFEIIKVSGSWFWGISRVIWANRKRRNVFNEYKLNKADNQVNSSDCSILCYGLCLGTGLRYSTKYCAWILSLYYRTHVWAVCPDGYFLQGLWRDEGKGLVSQIDKARCCKLNTIIDEYDNCYNENIWGSFDHYGLSECKKDGYYVAGIYKSNCDKIYCIEELKCCSMLVGKYKWSEKHFI